MIIKNYVSRYIVPFYFDYEHNGYNRIINKLNNKDDIDYKLLGLPKDCEWIQKGFWQKYKSDDDSQPEMDTYTYLLDLLKDDSKTEEGANLGTSYVLKTNGSILNLQYVTSKKDEVLNFRCTDLGTLIFRNGIGFIWYDIEFAKLPDSDVYIDFLHDFKELARTHSEKFRRRTGKDSFEAFCMGKWIAKIFDVEISGIKFWAEREWKTSENTGAVHLPDKALLFQYLFVGEESKQTRLELAYRIANGYDEKYCPPSCIENEIYEPFGNTCFYTSKAGMSYVVSNNESNEIFFAENFKEKYIRDYFFVYILLLYQTYSCAHYSKLLSKLPANVNVIEKDEEYMGMLESLDSQINLFLVKSVYESVSNIQHQNGAYIYGKRVLRIEEDVNSLTIGVAALRGFVAERKEKSEQEQKDKKEKSLNNGLVIFGFLVVISAITDGLALVDWFNDANNSMGTGHWAIAIVIAVLTAFMVGVLIVNRDKK